MIEDPDRWAPAYAEAGAGSVTFHLEAAAAPVRLAREIRAKDARLRRDQARDPRRGRHPPARRGGHAARVMTVEPGFGGQKFLDLCLPKIRQGRELISAAGLEVWLQVDGGVSAETIERCARRGRRLRGRLRGLRRRRPRRGRAVAARGRGGRLTRQSRWSDDGRRASCSTTVVLSAPSVGGLDDARRELLNHRERALPRRSSRGVSPSRDPGLHRGTPGGRTPLRRPCRPERSAASSSTEVDDATASPVRRVTRESSNTVSDSSECRRTPAAHPLVSPARVTPAPSRRDHHDAEVTLGVRGPRPRGVVPPTLAGATWSTAGTGSMPRGRGVRALLSTRCAGPPWEGTCAPRRSSPPQDPGRDPPRDPGLLLVTAADPVRGPRRCTHHPCGRLATNEQFARVLLGAVEFRTGGDSPRPGRLQRSVDQVELLDRRSESG